MVRLGSSTRTTPSAAGGSLEVAAGAGSAVAAAAGSGFARTAAERGSGTALLAVALSLVELERRILVGSLCLLGFQVFLPVLHNRHNSNHSHMPHILDTQSLLHSIQTPLQVLLLLF